MIVLERGAASQARAGSFFRVILVQRRPIGHENSYEF